MSQNVWYYERADQKEKGEWIVPNIEAKNIVVYGAGKAGRFSFLKGRKTSDFKQNKNTGQDFYVLSRIFI